MIIAVIVIFINFGHYTRNFDLFGSPIGISEESGYKTVNDVFTPSSLFSNVTRNIGLHLGTPVESINAATESGIVFLNALFGIDINDSRTTWLGAQFRVPMLSSGKDDAGNLIHFILILLSVVLFLIYRRKNKFSTLSSYFPSLVAAFLLFCLFLRWQPWHSRLQLPLFVLWSPFIAVVLSKTISRRLIDLIPIILIISALPWVFYNHNHPFVRRNNILNTSKTDLYFSASMELREPFMKATDFLKSQQCPNVGLLFGFASREYPLWQLLQEKIGKLVRIEHIDVNNVSAVKQNFNPFNQFNPSAVISDKPHQSENISTENGVYIRKFLSGTVSVFVKQ